MGLFTPTWKSKDWQKRYKAIERGKLSDDTLFEIAQSDPDLDVRMKACSYISSQEKLTEALISMPEYRGANSEGYTRHKWWLAEIAGKIKDPHLLARIVRANCTASSTVFEHISDNAILHTIAQETPETAMTRAALMKIAERSSSEQAWIEYGKAYGYDETVVSHIKDTAVLIKIARTNDSAHVRRTAIEKLDGDEVLFELLSSLRDEYDRVITVSKIRSAKVLWNIFNTDTSYFVKMTAAKRMIESMAFGDAKEEDNCLRLALWMIEHNTAETANPAPHYLDSGIFAFIAQHLPEKLLQACGLSLTKYHYEETGDFGNIVDYDGYEVLYCGECVTRILMK